MSSIRVHQGTKDLELPLKAGETLLTLLRAGGISLPAACGGKGRCGKCRVEYNGAPRLACRVFPQDGDRVVLPERSGGLILTEARTGPVLRAGGAGCGAAVDLGTTTVAVGIYDLSRGREVASAADWNAQAPYGADVISRIQYTLEREEGLRELSRCIREQVMQQIRRGMEGCGRPVEQVQRIFLAGNTAMQLLFAGRPVRGLASAPFRPDTLFREQQGDRLYNIPVSYAPCVSGFVGGDITAGLLASGLGQRRGNFLFLDIGTNGEMALGGADGYLCCSVASGPAFEGGGISCGMPGMDGAVSHVRYDRGFLYDVIGGGPAKGLCGSGLLDLAAGLLRLGLLDESGRLLPPEEAPAELGRYLVRDGDGNGLFRLTADVVLTAGDVRSLQLAKAAVAAGIRVLLEQRGLTAEKLDGIYLAGGFGSYLSPDSAAAIGMLPAIPRDRLHSLGNTALAGAAMAAADPEMERQMAAVANGCRYVELAGRGDFAAAFVECMRFGSGGS